MTYLVGDPPGQISIDVYAGDSGSLRDLTAAHTGAPNGGDPIHLWGSDVKPLTQVAGKPAVSFDTTSQGPGPLPTGHAVTLVLPDRNVFGHLLERVHE